MRCLGIFDCFLKKDDVTEVSYVKCSNYRLCKKELPEWEIRQYSGYCFSCTTTVGPIIWGSVGECQICNYERELVTIFCKKHELCLDCWIQITKRESVCPFCRQHLYDI